MGGFHFRVAIIGAGFGGIGAGIQLRRHGYDDFVIFDRGEEVGGTWRDNSYPGCACDVPSHMYSFSFAPNPNWTRSFSRQPEIWAYLRRCAEEGGLRPHLRLGHEVLGAWWDEADNHWVIDTSRGRFTAQVLVSAGGPLSEPATPDLPGLDTFDGEVFHSARWRHDLDLTGRRVAVVGTGASAIQFVPEIAPRVARLHLFQRTPPWVMPRRDRAVTRAEHALFRALPPAQRLARTAIYVGRELGMGTGFLHPQVMKLTRKVALRHLRRAIADPELRAKLTPDYTIGCKRILISNDYYPALARPNVELVTDPVERVQPDAVVTRDGTARQVDTIIFGTGFHVTDMPIARALRGRGGRTLAEAWHGGLSALLGTTVAGFPNLFLLLGPHTGLGHMSVVFMIECQVNYLLGALRHMDRPGVAAIEPTEQAQRAFAAEMDRRMSGTVWTTGGCRSWYMDATGKVTTLWPGYTFSYWLRTRRFRPEHYRTVAAAGVAAGRAAR
jgi:cation diffusion facilitator CzcD-associated flavoprotein CzcO